jgi:hypothetical protein
MKRAIPAWILVLASSGIVAAAEEPRAEEPSAGPSLPAEAVAFLDTFCVTCHQGERPEGKLDLTQFRTTASMAGDSRRWDKIVARVSEGEMPPEGNESPTPAARRQFVEQIKSTLLAIVCQSGPRPGPARIRRLNRTEYGATIRDLLGIQISLSQTLPDEGAGGEGFDNAAETLFLSPLHAEKYLEAAREALDYALKNPRSRRTFLSAEPDERTSPAQAARSVLERFLPLAFRRPLREGELDLYVALFDDAQRRGESFDPSISFALQGVLVSPHFLFRFEEPNPDAEPRLVGDYEIASRLSYFLWASMPDDRLLRVAAEGGLNQPDVLREQVARMLKDRKTRESVESFVEQWLGTRELGQSIKPDRELFRRYSNELEWSLKQEPVVFFQDLLAENRPLLELIDSEYTFLD